MSQPTTSRGKKSKSEKKLIHVQIGLSGGENKARNVPNVNVSTDEPSTSAAAMVSGSASEQVGRAISLGVGVGSDWLSGMPLSILDLPAKFLKFTDSGSSQGESSLSSSSPSSLFGQPRQVSSSSRRLNDFVNMCEESAEVMMRPLSPAEVTSATRHSEAAVSPTINRRALIPELLSKRLGQMALIVPGLRDRSQETRVRLLNQSSTLGYAILAVWRLDEAQQNLVANMSSGDTLFMYSVSSFKKLCDAMKMSFDSIVTSNQHFSNGLLTNFPDRQAANVVRVALALTYIFSPHHITAELGSALMPSRSTRRSYEHFTFSNSLLRSLLDIHATYMRNLTQYVQSISGDSTTHSMSRMIFCYEALADLQLLEGFGALQSHEQRATSIANSRIPLAYIQLRRNLVEETDEEVQDLDDDEEEEDEEEEEDDEADSSDDESNDSESDPEEKTVKSTGVCTRAAASLASAAFTRKATKQPAKVNKNAAVSAKKPKRG